MIPRQLLRKPNSHVSPFHPLTPFPRSKPFQRRFQSTTPRPSTTSARAARILDRVPRFLRPYTERLRIAPVSHLVSFLILHELTAIIPLVGLAGWFHYSNWLPSIAAGNETLKPGIEKFGRYFRRKGWFGLDQDQDSEADLPDAATALSSKAGQEREEQGKAIWNFASPGSRIVVEVAASYAIIKALLPLRLMLSVWATPWFARVIIGKAWVGIRGLGKGLTMSAAGGTGTTNLAKRANDLGKDIPKT